MVLSPCGLSESESVGGAPRADPAPLEEPFPLRAGTVAVAMLLGWCSWDVVTFLENHLLTPLGKSNAISLSAYHNQPFAVAL